MGTALNKQLFTGIVAESDLQMPHKSIKIFSEMSDKITSFSFQEADTVVLGKLASYRNFFI